MTSSSVTVVLGMHRSGTSLCSNILSVLGFNMSTTRSGDDANPFGYWERSEVNDFHDRILKFFDRDWHSPTHSFALPRGWWADPKVRAIRDEIQDWLKAKMTSVGRFGFKDPRTSLMLPMWDEIFCAGNITANFVVCVRSPASVARSLGRRGDVTDVKEGEHRWLRYNSQIIADVGRRRVCVIPFQKWFESGSGNLDRLLNYVNADPPANISAVRDAIRQIVRPDLCHFNANCDVYNSSVTQSVYETMLLAGETGSFSDGMIEVATMCCRFEEFIEPLRYNSWRATALEAQDQQSTIRLREAALTEASLTAELRASQTEVASLREQFGVKVGS